MKIVYGLAAAVLVFCAGAATDGLYRGAQVRGAIAHADTLTAVAQAATHRADSLQMLALHIDTVRVHVVADFRAAERLAPPVCQPVLAKADTAVALADSELVDLRAANDSLQRAVQLLTAANDTLRKAALRANDGAWFHLLGLHFERPSIALGVDQSLHPQLFLAVVSLRL